MTRQLEVQQRLEADVDLGLSILEAWPSGLLPSHREPLRLSPPIAGEPLGTIELDFPRPMLLRPWQNATRFGTTWQKVAMAALALANDNPTPH